MITQTSAKEMPLEVQPDAPAWKSLFQISGWAAWLLFFYSLATMLILVLIGGQPENAQAGFTLLQENRLTAFLRLDGLLILCMPAYYLLFVGVYVALKPTHEPHILLASVLIFAGVTLTLATPSAFSWLALGDRYAAAATPAEQAQLLAAGEAILYSDMWHGSGALIGGLLLQCGTLFVSVLMLGSRNFSKLTAGIGIVMHGLDLLHIPLGYFIPVSGLILMGIAGPLYLVWFPLLARDLFRLGRTGSPAVQ